MPRKTRRADTRRELHRLLTKCRDALVETRLRGWHYRATLQHAEMMLRITVNSRPADIGGLRWGLMECALEIRLALPPAHPLQELASDAEKAVLRTFALAQQPPRTVRKAGRTVGK
jgi:hypothetical protein